MRLLLALLTLAIPCSGAFYRTLTIDHTKVQSTTQSNFTVLVSVTNATLKTVGNGGHVQSSTANDILFYSDVSQTTQYASKIETYSASGGTVVAWVILPTVSPSVDTVFYVVYGNSSPPSRVTAPYDAGYLGVWSLPDGTTLSAADSVASNPHNGTITSTTATSGQIDGAGSFNGSTSSIDTGTPTTLVPGAGANWTISVWASPSANINGPIVSTIQGSSPYPGYQLAICDTVPGCSTTGSKLQGFYNQDGVTSFRNSVSTADIADGSLHYFVMVASVAANNTLLYVDGSPVTTTTSNAGSWPTVSNGDSMIIGNDHFGDSFTGKIDEVRISNVVRSADWIKTEYNNQFSPSTFMTMGSEGTLASTRHQYVAATPPTLVDAVTLNIITDSLPAGTTGQAYSQTLTAFGGHPPYTWDITSGTLPTGLSLSGAGVISGTPSVVVSPNITFRVTDSITTMTTRVLNLTVNNGGITPPPGAINVISDFGAVGNGSHDDTTNINNAIAACPGNSVKTVYFPTPSVNYKITNTLNLGVTGCTLIGDRGTSLITAVGSATWMLQASATNANTTIQNLVWNVGGFSGGLDFASVGTTGLVVSYNKIYNVSGIAVHIGDSNSSAQRSMSIDHNIIIGVNSITSGMKGVRFEGSITNTHVDFNYFDTFYQGIEKPSGTGPGGNLVMNGNTFIRGQRCGIEFTSTQNSATITNNWFGEWRTCQPGTNECGGNPNGFGNWFVFAQLISWATGGNNHNLSNNFLKCGDGMSNGIEWSATDPSILANNVIKVCTVTTYITTGTVNGMNNNVSCTPYNNIGGQYDNIAFWNGTDPSNHFYTSCSATGVPPDPATPSLPF